MIAKYLIPIVAILSFGGGSFFGTKVLAPKPQKIEIPPCPKCPDLQCPPAVSLNSFDAEKLNNKKGNFHLHNNISNVQLKIEAKDSTMLKALLRQAK